MDQVFRNAVWSRRAHSYRGMVYASALAAAKSYSIKPIGAPMDWEGMYADALVLQTRPQGRRGKQARTSESPYHSDLSSYAGLMVGQLAFCPDADHADLNFSSHVHCPCWKEALWHSEQPDNVAVCR
jgi:hypothetical protein